MSHPFPSASCILQRTRQPKKYNESINKEPLIRVFLLHTLCSRLVCWFLSRCLHIFTAVKSVTMLLPLKDTHTLINLLPSILTRILLPTISAGCTRSSRMASCTAVRVRLRKKGRPLLHYQRPHARTHLLGLSCFCFVLWFLFGLERMRRWAINTTGRPLNFFSSSLTSLT